MVRKDGKQLVASYLVANYSCLRIVCFYTILGTSGYYVLIQLVSKSELSVFLLFRWEVIS